MEEEEESSNIPVSQPHPNPDPRVLPLKYLSLLEYLIQQNFPLAEKLYGFIHPHRKIADLKNKILTNHPKQLRGILRPLKKSVRSLAGIFDAYGDYIDSSHDAWEALKLPIKALKNILTGIGYLVFSPFILIINIFRSKEKALPAVSWFAEGFLTLCQGIIQLALSPINLCLIFPVKKIITLKKSTNRIEDDRKFITLSQKLVDCSDASEKQMIQHKIYTLFLGQLQKNRYTDLFQDRQRLDLLMNFSEQDNYAALLDKREAFLLQRQAVCKQIYLKEKSSIFRKIRGIIFPLLLILTLASIVGLIAFLTFGGGLIPLIGLSLGVIPLLVSVTQTFSLFNSQKNTKDLKHITQQISDIRELKKTLNLTSPETSDSKKQPDLPAAGEKTAQQAPAAVSDKTPEKLLGKDYYIKSIRADDQDYFTSQFIYGITKNKRQKRRFFFRKGEQKTFVVNGLGVIKREKHDENPEKKNSRSLPGKYTPEEKEFFSQPQSVSLTGEVFSKLYAGFDDKREGRTLGIALHAKDVLLTNTLSFYDGGTVYRPNHFYTKQYAHFYAEQQIHEREILFNNVENFKAALKNPKKPYEYNEVLARIRWNTDGTSHLIIGSDNLETRLLAQHRAADLLERLKKQAQENGSDLDPNYSVPICFYSANPAKHLKIYDITQQQQDSQIASTIAHNKDLRFKKYQHKNYEFLLAIKDVSSFVFHENILEKLLYEKRLNIFVPLLKKMDNQTLGRVITQHGENLIEIIKNHPHHYYPDMLDKLVENNFFAGLTEAQKKIVLTLAVIQEREDILEDKFHQEKALLEDKNYIHILIKTISAIDRTEATSLSRFNRQPRLNKFINSDFFKDKIMSAILKDANNLLPENICKWEPVIVRAYFMNENFFNAFIEQSSQSLQAIWGLAVKNNWTDLMEKCLLKDENLINSNIKSSSKKQLPPQTALDILISRQQWMNAQLLIQKGADVSSLSENNKKLLLLEAFKSENSGLCISLHLVIKAFFAQDKEFIFWHIKENINFQQTILEVLALENKYKFFEITLLCKENIEKIKKIPLDEFYIKNTSHQKIKILCECLAFVLYPAPPFSINLKSIQAVSPETLDKILTASYDTDHSEQSTQKKMMTWVFSCLQKPDEFHAIPAGLDKKLCTKYLFEKIAVLNITSAEQYELSGRIRKSALTVFENELKTEKTPENKHQKIQAAFTDPIFSCHRKNNFWSLVGTTKTVGVKIPAIAAKYSNTRTHA